MAKPPPLPPRYPSHVSEASSLADDDRPPRYERHLSASKNSPYSGGFDDPRSSSQQSLRPDESTIDGRRTLLLVYLHGFLGDETSFRSFPAHVHNILSVTLAETHALHSKIYPRYKSRNNISVARDDFSKWLAPHESETTDIILVGHSLGGILAAEVVLLRLAKDPGSLQHRILGQIAFDTPFLGMHPGVVGTGIASLFRPAPDLPQQKESDATMTPLSAQTSTSGLSDFSLSPSDPNYNPTFYNDIHLANRQGKMERGWYFFNKHWGELAKASKNYVTSHLEFGGVLMDYPGMKRRYDAVRALEDIEDFDPRVRRARVRFVNYYSASTGRIKEQKEPSNSQKPSPSPSQNNSTLQLPQHDSTREGSVTSDQPSPRISVEEHREGMVVKKDLEHAAADMEHMHLQKQPDAAELDGIDTMTSGEPEMRNIDPEPWTEPVMEPVMEPVTEAPTNTSASPTTTSDHTQEESKHENLPSIPPAPIAPIPFDPSTCHDPDTLKLRQKEHDRSVKAYERAVRDRDKTIRGREKLVQKRDKVALKKQQKEEKEQIKRTNTLNPEAYDKQLKEEARQSQPPVNMQKDRKFCTLPPKTKGQRDPTWIRVYMEGMDEVVAHTSMFFVSDTYAKLVGDTAQRIESWVQHDMTRRMVEAARDEMD